MNTRIGPPPEFLAQRQRSHIATNATIEVTYTGFSAEGQAAVQYAVDIWASQIASPVAIEIMAVFEPLVGNVLGRGGSNLLYRDFPNAPQADTFYSSALANKLAGVDLYPDRHDINLVIDSERSWYFGTDGNPSTGTFDLVTVVLHEIGHGLGFAASVDVSGSTGSLSVPPHIFDRFVANGSGTAVVDLANPSTALADEFISDDLFFTGTAAIAANGGIDTPKLYAPAQFNKGSSISHWDEDTYPVLNPNSLMTPQLGMAEAIHSPGSLTLGAFEDMGWGLGVTEATAQFHTRNEWFANVPLKFTDFSVAAVSWAWDFDDDGGVDSTDQNPTYTFTTTGNHTVKLTINGNSSLTQTQMIVVLPEPVIPYTNDFNSDGGGFYSKVLQFTDNSGDKKWEWGSGTSGTLSGVFKTIEGDGNWMTGLADGHGFNTTYTLETPPFRFTNGSGAYVLTFEYRAATGADAGMNLEVSTDGGTTWSLLPDDAEKASGWYNTGTVGGLDNQPGWTGMNTTVFEASYDVSEFVGIADIRFRHVFGALGSSSAGVQIDNFAISFTPAAADFQVLDEWVANRPLRFTDASVKPTSWRWDFDNNGTVDAITQNPVHHFNAPGVYTSKLTINNDPTLTSISTVTILPEPLIPYANNFDDDGGGFLPSVLSGSGGNWERGTGVGKPNFNGDFSIIEGTASWMTNLTGGHGFNTQYVLETPAFSLDGGAGDYFIQFDYRGAVGTTDESGTDREGMNLEYSTDGGDSWNVLGGTQISDPNAESHWYTHAMIPGLDDMVPGDDPGWFKAEFTIFNAKYKINSFIGESDILFRFKFGATNFIIDGFQVDNFMITGAPLPPAISVQADKVISSEGDAETVAFNVRLNIASADTVTVSYAITGDAELSTDYKNDVTGDFSAATGGTITFAAGQQLKTVKFQVENDTVYEPDDETVTITLSTPNMASIRLSQATHVIVDDDVANPPVVTTTASELEYTENDGPVVIDDGVTVAAGDVTTLTGASVSVSVNHVSTEDVLEFSNTAEITGSFSSVTGELLLSGDDSAAGYQAALRTVTYRNTSDSPNVSPRTITFSVSAGLGTGSDTREITIIAANDLPTASDSAITTIEDSAYSFTITDFNFDDPDIGDTLSSVEITTVPAGDALKLNDSVVQALDIISGASIDSGQLTFHPSDNDYGSPYATFTFRVSDGVAFSSAVATMTVNVTAGNDPPNNTTAPSISGTPRLNETLTAAMGVWNDNTDLIPGMLTFSYQWQRADDDSGTNTSDIGEASAGNYQLSTDDIGKALRVNVTATDDGEGTPLSSATTAASPYVTVETVNVDVQLFPGWNLVSTPITLITPQITSFLAGIALDSVVNTGAVWVWQGDRFEVASNFEPGYGYWLYSSATENLIFTGNVLAANQQSSTLLRGWNLFGSKNIQTVKYPGADAVGGAWGWDNENKGYILTDSLEPGRGFWVYLRSPSTVTLMP